MKAFPSTDLCSSRLIAPLYLDWESPGFWERAALEAEQERIFDICHGCRRCVSLCHAFPTLFDLVDASETLEVDGVAKADFPNVSEQCYLCDLCYQIKCPYTPPHPWNVDFPHLMLRAKAVDFREHGAPLSARILSSTRTVGRLASIPVVAQTVNAANRNPTARKLLEIALDVDAQARVPSPNTSPTTAPWPAATSPTAWTTTLRRSIP